MPPPKKDPKTEDKAALSPVPYHRLIHTFGKPLRSAGKWLRDVNPDIPEKQDFTISIVGSWFLSPEQHVIEGIAFNALYLWLMYYSAVQISEDPNFVPSNQVVNDNGLWLDRAIGAVMLLCAIPTFGLKASRQWTVCLQPCHVFLVKIGLLLLLVGSEYHWMCEVVFNQLLWVQWGPWLALAAPDMRDYTFVLEIYLFYLEHYTVVLAPLYLVLRNRFNVYPNLWWSVFGYALWSEYHWIVLLPVSIIKNANINYMQSPPNVLRWMGIYYRILWPMMTLLLTVVSGAVVVPLCQYLSPYVA